MHINNTGNLFLPPSNTSIFDTYGNSLANGTVEGIGIARVEELWMATLMFVVVRVESSEGLIASLAECSIIVFKIVGKMERNRMNTT